MTNSNLKKIGFWTGLIIALLIIVIGILFVTKVITYQITPVIFGWVLIIIFAGLIIEHFILKIVKI